LDSAPLAQTKVFHAGTAKAGNQVVTSGGRVLGVTAWDTNLVKAQTRAYGAVAKIQFDGAHFRHDIAARAVRGEVNRL
jgi:phosphoribosylamine--glycine ligase